MKHPKISIITVNLNNKEELQKTIKSVLSQTFLDYEYIIIDGNSTDGSMDVIHQYADRLSYWISEKDNGVYNAMNKGVKIASGEYCLFLNSGDFLYNNDVLKTVFEGQQTADIVYGDMMIDWGNKKVTRGVMPEKITEKQMIEDTLWHPVSFIKRNLFERFGPYNEEYKIAADYDFFFKVIIEKKVSAIHLPVVISVFDNSNGLSSDPANSELLKNERRKVQKSYLHTSISETAQDARKNNNLSAAGLLKWLKKRMRNYGN